MAFVARRLSDEDVVRRIDMRGFLCYRKIYYFVAKECMRASRDRREV